MIYVTEMYLEYAWFVVVGFPLKLEFLEA